MTDAIYIYDAANGIHTTIGKTIIPLVTYVGPFESVEAAVDYLAEMTDWNKGADLPKGYAIIRMRQPLENWKSMVSPAPWKWKRKGRPFKFDLKLRYEQAPKKTRRKKK